MQPEALLSASRRPLAAADFLRFKNLVHEACGLIVPEVRRRDMERVVNQTIEELGLESTDALFRHLQERAGRADFEIFLGSLTVGETHFFRNRPQFEALEGSILPELIEKRRSSRRLRIWSAGCSSGEEPYSLAMLIRRLIPDLSSWNITILATDLNPNALERAQRGVYGSWSFREVPDYITRSYFEDRGDEFEVVPEVKSMVSFRYLNLVEDAYPSLPTNTVAMDLVLCRNVLIYFDDPTVRKVAERLNGCLADDGYLIVAPAEFSQDVFKGFSAVNFPGTVVYGKGSEEIAPTPAPVLRAYKPLIRQFVEPFVSPVPMPVPSIPEPAPETEVLDEFEIVADMTTDDPDDAEAPYLAARVLAGRLELEEATRYVAIALEREPLMAPAHYLSALILLESGDEEGALAALRRCVFADPKFILGHYMLGGLFARIGQQARAFKSFDNAAALVDGAEPETLVPDGDGLTMGRLLELIEMQKQMSLAGVTR